MEIFYENTRPYHDDDPIKLCIGLMHETTVDVRARYRMLENTESGTACKDSVLGEDNEYDCYLRCRLNHIKDMCKCTAPTLSKPLQKK
jgi:hypothetical protein